MVRSLALSILPQNSEKLTWLYPLIGSRTALQEKLRRVTRPWLGAILSEVQWWPFSTLVVVVIGVLNVEFGRNKTQCFEKS